MNQQAISVIIPCLNCREHLSASLRSVLQQTFPPSEIILIDDGSTDSSAELAVEVFLESDIPFRILRQSHKGLGAARNCGLESVHTAWVALLDADDVWFPNKLARIVKVLNSSVKKPDLIYHSTRALGGGRDRLCRPVWSVEDILAHGHAPIPSSCVLRTESLRKLKGFSENPAHLGAEDLHLWIRMLRAGMRFERISEFLGSYRAGGMSSFLSEHLQHVDNVLKDLHRVGYISDEHLRQARERKQYEAGRARHKEGRFPEALDHYSKVSLDFKALLFKFLALLRIRK